MRICFLPLPCISCFFFFLSTIFLFSFRAYSQEFSDKNEAIAAMKVSFITRKLNLTPKEAQAFWPVYNQYEEELETLRKNHRKMLSEAKDDFSQLSDADIEKMVDEQVKFKQNEIDVLKKYHPQFKKVLPVKKVVLLYRAEEEFKRHLIKQIKGK
jgi:Skp family chaperone for outer membrane proteins